MPRARRNHVAETIAPTTERICTECGLIQENEVCSECGIPTEFHVNNTEGTTIATEVVSEPTPPTPPTRNRRSRRTRSAEESVTEPEPVTDPEPNAEETPIIPDFLRENAMVNITRPHPRGAGFNHHKPNSMAKAIDAMLLEGVHFQEAVTYLMTEFGRDERKAINKFKGHITYLRYQGAHISKLVNEDTPNDSFYIIGTPESVEETETEASNRIADESGV